MSGLTKVVEFWVIPRDEWGDSIDLEFYDSEAKARGDYPALQELDDYRSAVEWSLEKVTRWYDAGGELKRESREELEL